MSYQQDIENLNWVNHRLPQRNRNNYISFIEGFLMGKNDKEFAKRISLYLHKVHQINTEYNTWIEQLDHYTYQQDKEMSLVDGLAKVLQELENYEGDLAGETQEQTSELSCWEEPKGKVLKQELVENRTNISVGDFIHLTDKIGEDYKYSRFYNASLRNPSWSLLYPSSKDFEEVYFYFDNEDNHTITNFGRARRLFSNTISKVEAITMNDKLVVYTDIFKINIKRALQKQEVKIIKASNKSVQTSDLSSVLEEFQYYSMGLMTLEELFKRDAFSYLPLRSKDWYNYHQSITGSWHKNEVSETS